MRKQIMYIVGIAWLFISCNGDNANDCFQAAGNTIQTTFSVPFFSEIRIEDDVSLIIKQGSVQEVVIETGDNLLNDISVVVDGGILIVKDNNRCNFVRDYGITKLFVTTPDLKKIRNSSEFDVRSEGELQFPSLRLVSNTTEGIEDSRKSGDFILRLKCEELWVEANGFSGFYLEGFSEKATVAFEDEVPRLEARNLIVNELRIFQRSANKMIVNPVESIVGIIKGTGDVICVNHPPIVEVEQIYTGQLLFED
jgi:Putative auto-transporter adhesin, head GIN domain